MSRKNITTLEEVTELPDDIVGITVLPPDAGDSAIPSDVEEASDGEDFEPAGRMEVELPCSDSDSDSDEDSEQKAKKWRKNKQFSYDLNGKETNFASKEIFELENLSPYQVWKNLFTDEIVIRKLW